MLIQAENAAVHQSSDIESSWFPEVERESAVRSSLRDAAFQVVTLLGGDRERAAHWVGIKLDVLEQLMEP